MRVIEEEEPEGMEEEDIRAREERLSRVTMRKRKWEAKIINRGIVMELVEKVKTLRIEEMARDWSNNMVEEVSAEGQLRVWMKEIEDQQQRHCADKSQQNKQTKIVFQKLFLWKYLIVQAQNGTFLSLSPLTLMAPTLDIKHIDLGERPTQILEKLKVVNLIASQWFVQK